MATKAILGVTRSELLESGWTFRRRSQAISPAQNGRNLVYQWPSTGTWTLQPIQLTSAFSESVSWESLKFRLTDCNYEPTAWTEVPENNLDGNHADYFFNMVVNSTLGAGQIGGRVASGFSDRFAIGILPLLEFMDEHGVNSIQSLNAYPANTGYCLRFYVEGRTSYNRGRYFTFYFGNFALVLNTTGMAELWQTANWNTYGMVYSFQWSSAANVHQRHHRLIIFPHARNKIEFLTELEIYSRGVGILPAHRASHMPAAGSVTTGLYEIPGELQQDAGGSFIVTQPANWALRISREFRHYIQISRLGFNNGTQNNARLFDSPVALDLPPAMPLTAMPDGDLNGGKVTYWLNNPDTGTQFTNDGRTQKVQFVITMKGVGDVAGPGLASTKTPELYGYTIDKSAQFQTVAYTPQTVNVMKLSGDSGESPESERLTIEIDNGRGEVNRWKRSGNIPLLLYDDETGAILFEGTAFRVRSMEYQKAPPRLVLDVSGMADNLLRKHWLSTRPDFGKDPADPKGQAWLWQSAVRRAFEVAGIDPSTEVVFDSVGAIPAAKFDFRLWLDGGSGGSRGGNGVGDGHHRGTEGSRWWPQQNAPIYEFLDFLIRGVLGWNWHRSKADRRWHIYKRPSVVFGNDEVGAAPVLARFTGSAVYRVGQGTPPLYEHRQFQTETVRPECTTVVCASQLMTPDVQSKADLARALASLAVGAATAIDPQIASLLRLVQLTLDNPNGYASPQHPNPDTTSVDYVGRRREKIIPLWMAATQEAFEWMSRRAYGEFCHGRVWATWWGDWGDPLTVSLKKWDKVQLDTGIKAAWEDWLIDRIEPEWDTDQVRQARYRASLRRVDAAPPY